MIVCRAEESREWGSKRAWGKYVIDKFTFMIVMMVSQLYMYVEAYQIVPIR